MKVYERDECKFTYPNDMTRILKYLSRRGKILVEHSIIEKLYYIFSFERYCSSWIDVNLRTLREFEEWMIAYEF